MVLRTTYARMAMEIEESVTDIFSHARKVLSLAKKTLGSTLTGTLRGFTRFKLLYFDLPPKGQKSNQEPVT